MESQGSFPLEFLDPRDWFDPKLPSGSSAGNAEGGKSGNFFLLAFPALQAEQGAAPREKKEFFVWENKGTFSGINKQLPGIFQGEFSGVGMWGSRRIPMEAGGGGILGKQREKPEIPMENKQGKMPQIPGENKLGKSHKFLIKTNKENSQIPVKNKQGEKKTQKLKIPD